MNKEQEFIEFLEEYTESFVGGFIHADKELFDKLYKMEHPFIKD